MPESRIQTPRHPDATQPVGGAVGAAVDATPPGAAGELVAGAHFGLGDRYRLRRLLGTGGMASVWLADDFGGAEPVAEAVAVKILADSLALDPQFVDRFRREAQIAGTLRHPRLVAVVDDGGDHRRPYLAMEYVRGKTLAQRMKADDPPDAMTLARHLLEAVAYVHDSGVVHRDIKPSNLLLTDTGEAKLFDFGIALSPAAARLTQTGEVMGTARYVAPEVLEGVAPTYRSDLYSCGVLLEVCVGASAPPVLWDVIDACTRLRTAERPASAREALALLERAGPARTPRPRSHPSTTRGAEPCR